MRAILYIFILVIVAAAAAPYGASWIVERKYTDMVAKLNELYEGEAPLSMQYSRGYFTSTAKTKLEFPGTKQAITLEDTIHNGPVIFDFKGWGDLSSYVPQGFYLAVTHTTFTGAIEQAVKGAYKGQDGYTITTYFNYNGHGRTVFKMLPLTMDLGYAKFAWEGISYNMYFDGSLNEFSGDIDMPSISYAEQGNSLMFKSIVATFDNNLESLVNSMKLNIGDVTLTEAGKNVFVMRQFSMIGSSRTTNELLTGDLEYSVGELDVEDHEFGPLNLSLKVQNINTKIANEMSSNPNNSNQDVKVLEFLSYRPMLDTMFNIATPMGGVDIMSHLEVGGSDVTSLQDDSLVQSMIVTADMKIAIQIVDIMLQHYIESEIINKERVYFMQNRNNPEAKANPYVMSPEDLKMYVSNWVQAFKTFIVDNNYVVTVNDSYETKIKVEKGLLYINDEQRDESDLQNFQSIMDIQIEPKSTSSDQVSKPVTAEQTNIPTEQENDLMETGIEEPPSQLQPMTEEEAEQKLNEVPTAPTPAI